MITYQGGEYEFDFEHVTMPEWREIKRKFGGMTIRQLLEGIEQIDPDAVTAVRWLLLRSDRKHDDLVLNPDEEFDAFEFLGAWKASEDAKAAEKEPDPTLAGSLPATETPASNDSSTLTLMSSPDSTSSGLPGSAESGNGKSAISRSADSFAM